MRIKKAVITAIYLGIILAILLIIANVALFGRNIYSKITYYKALSNENVCTKNTHSDFCAKKEILDILFTLNKLDRSVKKKTVIYISRTNKQFWSSIFTDCASPSLIVPWASGIAMIHGLPDKQCFLACRAHYGVLCLPPYYYTPVQDKYNDVELCHYASEKGFQHIIKLNFISGKWATKFINCM